MHMAASALVKKKRKLSHNLILLHWDHGMNNGRQIKSFLWRHKFPLGCGGHVSKLFIIHAVSFHSTRSDARVRFDSGAIFLDQSQSLLRRATNEISSFWIDHRSRQMAFFSCKGGAKAGRKAGFRVMLKYFAIKKAFHYYIKQLDSMLPCVWFSNSRSPSLGACNYPTFLSRRFHRPIYF